MKKQQINETKQNKKTRRWRRETRLKNNKMEQEKEDKYLPQVVLQHF